MNDTRWLCIVTGVVRGCIIGLAARCFLGVLGGVVSMWPDVDHVPGYTAILFPEVYGSLARFAPRFLHLFFFRALVVACASMATLESGCTVAVVKKLETETG